MGREFITSLVAIGTAIIGLSIVAVLVAQHSQTTSVIGAITTGFAKDITAAVSPVTGTSVM